MTLSPNSEIRIDQLLVDRRLSDSRTSAQRLIKSGAVVVNGEVVVKSNKKFAPDCHIVVHDSGSRQFVSRGGEKLQFALDRFGVVVKDLRCLDIGISTGGFTDCLLQAGAQGVIGVDVGHGQLHPKLLVDSRVTLHEGKNARDLDPSIFGSNYDLVVIDVSFISLELILPSVVYLINPQADLICLIKPQFEVGPAGLGKNAVVRDVLKREEARHKVHRCAASLSLFLIDSIESPITGGDGNIEFLSYFKKQ